MTASENPIISHRHPRVLWSRLKLKWPFLVWLLAIGALVWVNQSAVRTGTVAGVIEVIHQEPAPTETARLIKLNITEAQRIEPGDVIAEFDTAILDAQIAEIQSQSSKDQLEFAAHAAELEARYKLEHTQMERQFETAIGDGLLRQRDLTLKYNLDLARLDVLSNQLRQINGLIGTSTTEARDLVIFRSELESLARTTALYPAAIAQTETDIAAAREQLITARQWTNSIAPVTTAINAQERYANARELIAALKKRKEGYAIRATSAGIIARINHRVGDVVPAASPVATILIESEPRIIAFVPEWMVHEIHVGDEGIVTQPLRKILQMKATVTVIGAEIVTLPGTASPVPGQSLRGRRVALKLEGINDLVPGESIAVSFGGPVWEQRLNSMLEKIVGAPTKSDSRNSKPAAKDAE